MFCFRNTLACLISTQAPAQWGAVSTRQSGVESEGRFTEMSIHDPSSTTEADMHPFRLLGCIIGYVSSIDGDIKDHELIVVKDFEPSPKYRKRLPPCTVLKINWLHGTWKAIDHRGIDFQNGTMSVHI